MPDPNVKTCAAPTISSLPPEDQHREALGRLRDIAEWAYRKASAARDEQRKGAANLLHWAADHAGDAADSLTRCIARGDVA